MFYDLLRFYDSESEIGHQSGHQAADLADLLRGLRSVLGPSFGKVWAPGAAKKGTTTTKHRTAKVCTKSSPPRFPQRPSSSRPLPRRCLAPRRRLRMQRRRQLRGDLSRPPGPTRRPSGAPLAPGLQPPRPQRAQPAQRVPWRRSRSCTRQGGQELVVPVPSSS